MITIPTPTPEIKIIINNVDFKSHITGGVYTRQLKIRELLYHNKR